MIHRPSTTSSLGPWLMVTVGSEGYALSAARTFGYTKVWALSASQIQSFEQGNREGAWKVALRSKLELEATSAKPLTHHVRVI